jgi:Bacterial Ig-like domain (group 3)/Autotransporter beta-domain
MGGAGVTLPANSSLTNGTGTFSATLKTTGGQTITATDTNTSSITGTSNQIAVSNAGATHFAVSAPAAVTAGAPLNFTVTAQDQFNNTATGYTGTVHFTSTDGQAVLPANSTLTNGAGTFSATLKTTGAQTITATDTTTSSITGTSNTITVGQKASSTTTLASSQNPSSFGQSVTFTATAAGSGTPTGTITFKDGATVLGTSTLNAGAQASFATASLSIGTHAITATYSGDLNNLSSTSAALNQAVNVPADSMKLRALQIEVTKIEAQGSGQAVSGAIDSAIADAFAGGGPVSASDNGVHFNFAADAPAQEKQKTFEERFGYAFSALGYAGDPVVKAVPRAIQKEWFPWADVRGINWSTGLQTGDIRGGQTNGLIGLTRKLSPDVLVGAFAGAEFFDYTSQLLNGRLKGDGWTAGGYFSWRMLPGLRFDLGGGHSEISYDGLAGTAAGSFPGHRWIASAALVGSIKTASGFEVEPSARVYGLWEHEDAYTDTLGVTQADRDFSSGRASAGAKVGYGWRWSATTLIFPYVGGYADYYFNNDNAVLPAGAPFLLPTQFVQGWSARVTSGVGVAFSSGPQFSIGGEVGGLGSNQFTTWTVRGRAAVPF